MNKTGIVSKLYRLTLAAFAAAAFLSPGGRASADDREDAKAIVGKWKYQGILGDDYELRANGTYTINGLGGKGTDWTVKKGKFIFTPIIGKVQEYDFTLTPDGNTLKFNGNTYKRTK